MKKILIVDDEKMARDRIKRFLTSLANEIFISEAENAQEALEKIKNNKPDIIFLDIQMPVMTGFDLLYQIEDRNFQIIFQTAYDEFAVKAFEVNACDYLLKPFTEDRLLTAMKKAFNLLEQKTNIQKLEKHLEASKIYLNTVISKSGIATRLLKVSEIMAFKSEDHYTFAITEKGEYIIENSLSWLEEKLDPNLFVRCHRSNLVQMEHVDKIGSTDNSLLYLKNGTELPLSRESRKKLKERNLLK
jgi:two-component system LytT family response regulator